MSIYTIADIVSLTGIKAHRLRKWESRYHFIVPNRTETNIRFYTDSHLKKLLNVGILIRNGYKVSQIDTFSEGEIHQHITKILLHSNPENDLKALLIGMLEMDENVFNEVMGRRIAHEGLISTIITLIYPFLNHVGILWGINKAMPSQEHFMSTLIKQKLFSEIEALPVPKKGASKLLLFLPEGEVHEIGLLLAYYIAKELGWRTYYLGQNIPLEDILQVEEIVRPELLMTLITVLDPNKIQTYCSELRKGTSVPLAISGTFKPSEATGIPGQTVYLKKPQEFMELLNKMAVDKHQ